MRVLTFLHSFEAGGVERVALRLVRRWRACGVDAPLFIGRSDGPLRAELAGDLAYTVPKPVAILTMWLETAWMILQLPREIRRTRPDILFCAGSTYTVVAVAMKLRLRGACPPIAVKISNDIARRDLAWPGRLAWRGWLWLQGRMIDRWIVMEDSMLADSVATIRPASGAVVVIPDPAISLDQWQALGAARRSPDPARRRFVAVGRMVAQKDYPAMLRAFADGALPGDTLTIFGDGPARPEVERTIRQLDLGTRVDLTGHVPDAAAHVVRYDALLMSSAYEGIPAAVIEALAAGLPVIATDCGPGVRALLGQGSLGTIVARGDDGAFGAAIQNLRDDPSRVTARRAQARRFTLEGAADRYIAAFEECGAPATRRHQRRPAAKPGFAPMPQIERR